MVDFSDMVAARFGVLVGIDVQKMGGSLGWVLALFLCNFMGGL